MTDREAMKLALEALEADEQDMVADKDGHMVFRVDAAITALRQAIEQAEQYNATSDHCLMENAQVDLERVKLVQTGVGIGQPEQAQPVAWMWLLDGKVWDLCSTKDRFQPMHSGHVQVPLYTAPPPRQPLTDEEMWKLWNAQGDDFMEQQAAIAFARAIEAAHGIISVPDGKEKNT